jgi:hypothetical protein
MNMYGNVTECYVWIYLLNRYIYIQSRIPKNMNTHHTRLASVHFLMLPFSQLLYSYIRLLDFFVVNKLELTEVAGVQPQEEHLLHPALPLSQRQHPRPGCVPQACNQSIHFSTAQLVSSPTALWCNQSINPDHCSLRD